MNREMHIILAGTLALSGAQKIVSAKEKEICDTYPRRIMERIMEKDVEKSAGKAADAILSESCVYKSGLGEGGFFKGLWDMALTLKSGFSVDMSEVTVMQEIIEICEMFEVNPYITESKGAYILVSGTPSRQTEVLKEAGIQARIIGRVEEGKDKKLIIGDRIRFLDRPSPDEILRFHRDRADDG